MSGFRIAINIRFSDRLNYSRLVLYIFNYRFHSDVDLYVLSLLDGNRAKNYAWILYYTRQTKCEKYVIICINIIYAKNIVNKSIPAKFKIIFYKQIQ